MKSIPHPSKPRPLAAHEQTEKSQTRSKVKKFTAPSEATDKVKHKKTSSLDAGSDGKADETRDKTNITEQRVAQEEPQLLTAEPAKPETAPIKIEEDLKLDEAQKPNNDAQPPAVDPEKQEGVE